MNLGAAIILATVVFLGAGIAFAEAAKLRQYAEANRSSEARHIGLRDIWDLAKILIWRDEDARNNFPRDLKSQSHP